MCSKMATSRSGRSAFSKPSYGLASKSYIATKIKSRSKSVEDITASQPSFKSTISRYGSNDRCVDDSTKSYSQNSNIDCSDKTSGENTNKTRFQFFGQITKTPSPVLGSKSAPDLHHPKKSSRVPSNSVSCKENRTNTQSQEGKVFPTVGISRGYPSYRTTTGRYTKDNNEKFLHTSYPRPTRPAFNAENIRRSRSCEALQEGRTILHHEKSYPVCHRFPNCSVCTIDIKHQEKSKEQVVRAMQDELKEDTENMAILEQKDKEISLKSESLSQITQLLQKTKKELEHKTSECVRRENEIKHVRDELKCISDEKKVLEHTLSEQQLKVIKLESAETRLSQITEKYDQVLAENRELAERIKNLEINEKEFIDLERNVIELQTQLHDMEDIELHRDELLVKLQDVKKQRDEFLEKGKMVEEERNEFVRSNKTLEQYILEWKRKTTEFKKTNQGLKDRIISVEKDKKELESRIHDIQSERTSMQTVINKLEAERDDLLREMREMKLDQQALEAKTADLEDAMYDYDHLEEGFHSLRLKLAELTRQRDDTELLIPSYKAKVKVLKKTLREKEESIMQLSHEIKTMKVIMENFTYDDLSHFKSISGVTSDSSNTNQRSTYSKKYRASDMNVTSESETYDLMLSRLQQGHVDLSDDSESFTKDERKRNSSNRRKGPKSLVPTAYHEEVSEEDNSQNVQYHNGKNARNGRERHMVALYDYDPYTMGTTDRPELQLPLRKGDLLKIYGTVNTDGYYIAVINGKEGLVPSNFVEEHSPSSFHTSIHNGLTKPNTISSESIQQMPGPPFAPQDLKVIRVVTKNAVLLGWQLPNMDDQDNSNGCRVTGYKIWVNGKLKQEVNSAKMTKAFVDDVDLNSRVEFSIQTMGEQGLYSEKCHFAITGALSTLNSNTENADTKSNLFVALYDYDPQKSSPNPNPTLEVSFQEGDLIKVFDTSRSDGFYGAEVNGRKGLVPSNFIEKVTNADSSDINFQHGQKTNNLDADSRRVSFKSKEVL